MYVIDIKQSYPLLINYLIFSNNLKSEEKVNDRVNPQKKSLHMKWLSYQGKHLSEKYFFCASNGSRVIEGKPFAQKRFDTITRPE